MTITLWFVVVLAALVLAYVVRRVRRDTLKKITDRNAEATTNRLRRQMQEYKRRDV